VKFRYLYMLSLGLVLIVVVLALPRGLAGLVRARRPGCGSPSPTL
jgi:ABC-type branched-subunit amino acid transport system permease subunit